MRHIPDDGDFFDGANSKMHQDFGFSSSINKREMGGHPPFGGNKPTHDAASAEQRGDYARGGAMHLGNMATRGIKHIAEPAVPSLPGAYAHGGTMHPHGVEVVHEEQHATGGRICHMAHGGYTVEHPDGRTQHFTARHREVQGTPSGGEYAGHSMHLHPHGHAVTHVEQELSGAVIHHHEHGGYSKHHPDGRVTHHMGDDTPAHLGMIGMDHGMDGEAVVPRLKRARGGDMAQDKAMVRKAFREHEDAEHDGHHENLKLARGGRPHMPHGMAARPMSGGSEMPINQPPRFARKTTTPRNIMPGGEMAYGVEPGSEPDVAGSEQDVTPLRRGGRAKR